MGSFLPGEVGCSYQPHTRSTQRFQRDKAVESALPASCFTFLPLHKVILNDHGSPCLHGPPLAPSHAPKPSPAERRAAIAPRLPFVSAAWSCWARNAVGWKATGHTVTPGEATSPPDTFAAVPAAPQILHEMVQLRLPALLCLSVGLSFLLSRILTEKLGSTG